MDIPDIKGYRVEEVEVPAPKEQRQAILESLKLAQPSPTPGTPRRMIRITIDADTFPMTNMPYDIFIGNQKLQALAVEPGGNRASALIAELPAHGEPIAFHMPNTGGATGQTVVVMAGSFDTSKLDNRIA
jgi:hypothetical protein